MKKVLSFVVIATMLMATLLTATYAAPEGLGIGLISCSGAQDYEKMGKLLVFPFEKEEQRRKLYIAKHKNSILSPIAQKFYDFACEYSKEE